MCRQKSFKNEKRDIHTCVGPHGVPRRVNSPQRHPDGGTRHCKSASRTGGKWLYNQAKIATRKDKEESIEDAFDHIARALAAGYHPKDTSYTREDLASEARLKMIVALPKILLAANPEGYAWQVGSNHLRNIYKRADEFAADPISSLAKKAKDGGSRFRHEEGAKESNSETTEGLIGPYALQQTFRVARTELLSLRIREFVNDLPEQMKRVVGLYFWDEKTFREISDELNLSTTRVWEIYSQATRRLKAALRPVVGRRFDLCVSRGWQERSLIFN